MYICQDRTYSALTEIWITPWALPSFRQDKTQINPDSSEAWKHCRITASITLPSLPRPCKPGKPLCNSSPYVLDWACLCSSWLRLPSSSCYPENREVTALAIRWVKPIYLLQMARTCSGEPEALPKRPCAAVSLHHEHQKRKKTHRLAIA